MAYTYEYPRPALTADVIAIAALGSGSDRELAVLLIRRGRDPFAGSWAFPGGFVEENEGLATAALRELAEETGFSPPKAAVLVPLGAYGEPGRDPRGHTVSAAFLLWLAEPPVVAGTDDAVDARLVPLKDLLGPVRPNAQKLAFDHHAILKDAIARAKMLLATDPRALLGVDPRAPEQSVASVAEIAHLFAALPVD